MSIKQLTAAEKWLEGWRVIGRLIIVYICAYLVCVPLFLVNGGLLYYLGEPTPLYYFIIVSLSLLYLPWAYYYVSDITGYLKASANPKADISYWRRGYWDEKKEKE